MLYVVWVSVLSQKRVLGSTPIHRPQRFPYTFQKNTLPCDGKPSCGFNTYVDSLRAFTDGRFRQRVPWETYICIRGAAEKKATQTKFSSPPSQVYSVRPVFNDWGVNRAEKWEQWSITWAVCGFI